MSIIRRSVNYACPILLFLVGLFQLGREIFARYAPFSWQKQVENLLAGIPLYSQWAWWLVLIILPLAVFVLWLQSIFARNVLILKGESGQPLKIREAAVNRYVHDYLAMLPFVRSAKVRSRSAAGSLELKVNVCVVSAGALDHLQRRILEQVTAAAQDGLGINRVADIDMSFESVQLSRSEAKKRAAESKAGLRAEPRPEAGEERPAPAAAKEPPEGEAPVSAGGRGDSAAFLGGETYEQDNEKSNL